MSEEIAEAPPAPRHRKYSRAEHLTRCHNAYEKAARAVITFGLYLHEMKEDLGLKNEEWAALLRDEFNIAAGTASKLMKLGTNPVLSAPGFSPGKNLPLEWTVTYELIAMPEADLRRAIESGQVRPGMSRADARMIAKGTRPPEQKQAEAEDDREEDDDQGEAEAEHHHEWVCQKCKVPMPAGARPFNVVNGEVLETENSE